MTGSVFLLLMVKWRSESHDHLWHEYYCSLHVVMSCLFVGGDLVPIIRYKNNLAERGTSVGGSVMDIEELHHLGKSQMVRG